MSDSDKIFRYTDEGEPTIVHAHLDVVLMDGFYTTGETSELCRWTVDLAALPSYNRIAQSGGGYVEFDLGLEVDSAEVRGVLMTDEGVECGRASE